ncbi:hypothetical protein MUK42_29400 [Musa troglodytarum]|uniref:Uncharacterized protein n=1 Tax=Musa troglodytarum TaxID=320322 RepID=A0A9E7FMU0_9LILI|nr:hypothetical protein MUK42_29400 [Musa troglodytarum]
MKSSILDIDGKASIARKRRSRNQHLPSLFLFLEWAKDEKEMLC